MATHLKLPYGLHDTGLLHIEQVANGLACECVCPSCGAQLVARNQGRKRLAHFAHYQALECAHGLQTALHLAAKDIISRHLTFRLPELRGRLTLTSAYRQSFPFDVTRYWDGVPDEVMELRDYCFPAQDVAVTEVRIEQKTGDIIPDIVLVTSNGRQLLVEVAVTHFIDNQKLAKIKELGLSCLEIDLSKLPRELDLPQLEALLIHGVDEKKWVYNARRREQLVARRQKFYEAARPYFIEAHAKELEHRRRNPTSAWSPAQWQNAAATYRAERQALAAKRHLLLQERQRQDAQLYAALLRPVVVVQEIERQNAQRVIQRARQHVPTCPLAPRCTSAGEPYASVEADCGRCGYYKGYLEEEQAVVCQLKQPNEGAPA